VAFHWRTGFGTPRCDRTESEGDQGLRLTLRCELCRYMEEQFREKTIVSKKEESKSEMLVCVLIHVVILREGVEEHTASELDVQGS
jgi:hypothetical protein